MRFSPSRRSWFVCFNNPVFHSKIQSGTLFTQPESNWRYAMRAQSASNFPGGSVPEALPENVTSPDRKPRSDRKPDRLEDRRIRSKTIQPTGSARPTRPVLHCRSTSLPTTLLVTSAPCFYNPPKVAPEAAFGTWMVCPPYRAQPPSTRVVHSASKCLKFISLYVSPRSNK